MFKKLYLLRAVIACLIGLAAITRSQAQSSPTSMTLTWDAIHGKQVIYGNKPTNKADIPCDATNLFISMVASFSSTPISCPGGTLAPTSTLNIEVTGDCTPAGTLTYVTELSDATGSFSNPTILAESEDGNITYLPIAASPYFTLPANLPTGSNYRLRIGIKNFSVFSQSIGPYVIGAPDPQLSNLVADETGCPVKIQAQNLGNSVVLTGPNGYVFSYAYRQYGPNSVVFTPPTAGTYTLSSYSSLNNPACPSTTPQPVQQTVQISRNCP